MTTIVFRSSDYIDREGRLEFTFCSEIFRICGTGAF